MYVPGNLSFYCVLFIFGKVLLVESLPTNVRPRVCIIGAGIAGLTTGRHMKEEGIDFTILEATNYVGGTWRYEERVGTDEYGLPIHTSMYKHLRTNLPRPTMELRDFPIPEEYGPFPSHDNYYNYLKAYAKHFELHQFIKFLHNVISVKRIGNKWKVQHKHLPTGEAYEEEYDYVIISSGHYSRPKYPKIPGEELFRGTIIHSHDYREPEPFKCHRVLMVGAGPSGMDISLDVAEVSSTLIHSHHSKLFRSTKYPPNYIHKPDVKEFNETGAIFVDGTFEEIDDVIYSTGYLYEVPFVDQSCGVDISAQSVTPLYNNIVNINEPTMLFIGLVKRACMVLAIEAQSLYAAALVQGKFQLPSQKEMMSKWQRHADALRSHGRPLSDIHLLAEKEDQYYANLTRESGIERVPPVMFKIRNVAVDSAARVGSLYTYRDFVYTVVDRENFTRHRYKVTVAKNSTCTVESAERSLMSNDMKKYKTNS